MGRKIAVFALFLLGSVLIRQVMTSDMATMRRDLDVQNAVDVSVLDWSRPVGPDVAAKVLVVNRNDVAVRSIKLTCYASDDVNTSLGSASPVLPGEVEPKGRRAFEGVNLGALDPRTTRVSCGVLILDS